MARNPDGKKEPGSRRSGEGRRRSPASPPEGPDGGGKAASGAGEPVLKTASVTLLREDAGHWAVFRLECRGRPGQEDLAAVAAALCLWAGKDARPVCVVPGEVEQPNSRVMAALVGLLETADGGRRRVALARPPRAWTDMLEILGVRSGFLTVEDPSDLSS